LNKVLHDVSSEARKEEMRTKIKDAYKVPLVGIIPCFCEVLKGEGNVIFAQERPEHPFAKILDEIADKIDNNKT
jgi:hypothetical protein